MRGGVVLSSALAVLATASAAVAEVTPAAPLGVRLSDVASQFCVDILSRKVALPATPDEEQVLFARYGLTSGLPNAAMQALGRNTSLVDQATLASGEASDGAFMVALGGSAGETCRIIVYRAPLDGLFINAAYQAMQMPAQGWRSLPVPKQPTIARKLSLFKRDTQNRPFLANILAPTSPGPIAAIVTVAAIPANVTIPKGY
ncbi:MAG: hypothetical protein ABL912_04515 [Novosphingobium sp.]